MFGTDLSLIDYGSNSRVYYATLATPQRLVVEYVNMYPCCGSTPVTFQVVLYPGGDIEVRYKQLSGQTTPFVGIENQTGSDGLRYTGGLANNLAVLYRYPVGVFLTPPTLANIGAPGSTITYALSVTNRTGSSENFDLSLEPGHAWPATLSMAQTGPLAANASLEFDVFVEVPRSASSGDTDQLTVRASSVSTPATYDTAVLTSTASTGDVAVVTLSDVDRVALVDSELHTLFGTVNVGAAGCDFPWRATKTPDGSEVYVSCNYSDSVAVINLASRDCDATCHRHLPRRRYSLFQRRGERLRRQPGGWLDGHLPNQHPDLRCQFHLPWVCDAQHRCPPVSQSGIRHQQRWNDSWCWIPKRFPSSIPSP